MEKMTIAYKRVSTEGQLDGFGLEAQQERIDAYAKAMDLRVDEVISDEGISGATLDRPGLEKLIDLIQQGKVAKVIVYKLDRISRSLKNLLILFEDIFEANGCALVSVSEQFDTSTHQGKMFFHILGSFAEYERGVITERLAGGRAAKAQKGDRATGAVALGYRVEEVNGRKQTVADDSEAEVVRTIFEMFNPAKKNYTAIANHLNAEGVPTKRGGKWYASTVKYIVENSTYQGVVSYDAGGQHITSYNDSLRLIG